MLNPVNSFVVDAIVLLTLNYGFPAAVSSTTTPRVTNLIAVTGLSMDAILSCSTKIDASVAFYFTPYKGSVKEIFDRNQMLNDNKSKFNVSKNGNTTHGTHYVLGTDYVREYHAGEYFCTENNGIGSNLSASFLTVFGEFKLMLCCRCNENAQQTRLELLSQLYGSTYNSCNGHLQFALKMAKFDPLPKTPE